MQSDETSPLHHLIVDGLKGCWTPSNRAVVMNLYDSYSKAERLKKSLSADAVQGFKLDTSQTPQVCNDLGLISVSLCFNVYTVSHQNRATLFLIITPAFLGRFLYFLYQ